MNATTHTSTSKKFNQMVEGQHVLQTTVNNRRFQVWFDWESNAWTLRAGRVGGMIDYTETHTDLAQLEKSMREVASFRSWNFSDWA